jgi:hypothetical protein
MKTAYVAFKKTAAEERTDTKTFKGLLHCASEHKVGKGVGSGIRCQYIVRP